MYFFLQKISETIKKIFNTQRPNLDPFYNVFKHAVREVTVSFIYRTAILLIVTQSVVDNGSNESA